MKSDWIWVSVDDLKPGMVWKGCDQEYTILEVKRVDIPSRDTYRTGVVFDHPDVEATGSNWRHFRPDRDLLIKDEL